VKNFVLIGIAPVTGGLILSYMFVRAFVEYSKVDASYTGSDLFGMALPAVIGGLLLIIGVILSIVWRLRGNDEYFGRKTEVVDPAVAAGHREGVAAVPEGSV